MRIRDQSSRRVVNLDTGPGNGTRPLENFLQCDLVLLPVLSCRVIVRHESMHPRHLCRVPVPLEPFSLLACHYSARQPDERQRHDQCHHKPQGQAELQARKYAGAKCGQLLYFLGADAYRVWSRR